MFCFVICNTVICRFTVIASTLTQNVFINTIVTPFKTMKFSIKKVVFIVLFSSISYLFVLQRGTEIFEVLGFKFNYSLITKSQSEIIL